MPLLCVRQVCQQVFSEQPYNIRWDDMNMLAGELSIRWKYFVLCVSIDQDRVSTEAQYARLRGAIYGRKCGGKALQFFFKTSVLPLELLDRIVVAFTSKVTAEKVSTALFSQGFSLSANSPSAGESLFTTAGLVFDTTDARYAVTSLHGTLGKGKVQTAEAQWIILADAFRTDDEKMTNASEVGHVAGDWRTDHVDVGFIQLHGEHKAAELFTEDDVIQYMVPLMRRVNEAFEETFQGAPVLVHSPPCFRGAAGSGPIPGTIRKVKTITPLESDEKTNTLNYEWHLVVQLAPGFKVVPGQSGSAVTMRCCGHLGWSDRPVGVLVARYKDDHSIAIVTPLHAIFSLLNDVLGREKPSRMQLCHSLVAAASHAQSANSLAEDNNCSHCTTARECCALRQQPHLGVIGGLLKERCVKHRAIAHNLVKQMTFSPLSDDTSNRIPSSYGLWKKCTEVCPP